MAVVDDCDHRSCEECDIDPSVPAVSGIESQAYEQDQEKVERFQNLALWVKGFSCFFRGDSATRRGWKRSLFHLIGPE